MPFQSYAAIKGTKQGQIKGETKSPKRTDKWLEVLAFNFNVLAPRDASSGLPSGKRQHSPITITKEWGAASPQLMNAHWTSEILQQVIIEVVGGPSTGGRETVTKRITLTNAQIIDIRPHVGREAHSGKILSDYAFVYEKIDVEDLDPSKSASSDWATSPPPP